MPPRLRASTEIGRAARRSSPRRAQASTVSSAAVIEQGKLARRARLSKQTLPPALLGRKRGDRTLVMIFAQKENPRFTGVLEADDGTRTHDLLHGKCARPFAPVRACSLKPS